MDYICGLDLGQASDFTALCILQAHPETPPAYDVVELKRWPLQTGYPAIVRDVVRLLDTPPLRGHAWLVLDGTGVGTAVTDMFKETRLPHLITVSIHGGETVSQQGQAYRVPKRDLVGCVQVLLQDRRLRIAQALPEAPTLQAELLTFRVKIDPQTAHDSYSSWRENQHDDLVLATALACWWGGYRQRKQAGVWGAGRFQL